MSLNQEFEECRERAVLFLGLNYNKASGRVRNKLLQETYDPDNVEAVIDYLKEIDYINDERAAQSVARRYTGKRLRSQKAMLYVFREAGVEDGVAKRVAADLLADEDSSLDLLQAFYRKAPPSYEKAMRLLARRGYSAYIAARAVKQYLSEQEDLS